MNIKEFNSLYDEYKSSNTYKEQRNSIIVEEIKKYLKEAKRITKKNIEKMIYGNDIIEENRNNFLRELESYKDHKIV